MSAKLAVRSGFVALALGVTTHHANATPFDITLDYASPVSAGISEAMDTAALIWEYLLPSYSSTPRDLTGLGIADPLLIEVNIEPIDGVGGILGSAGPDIFATSSDLQEIYIHEGSMTFDSEDLAGGGTFTEAVTLFMHEMGHVIGFGTLWDNNFFTSVQYDLTNGTGGATSTQYTGANALAAYQGEVDPMATFIPLEDGGGTGTVGAHWDEAAAGASLVPGNFFGPELMSGFFFGGPSAFVSETTVASFADIGFTTRAGYEAMTIEQLISAVTITPVPLPAGVVFLGSGVLILGAVRRRRRQPMA